jgi:hypothetical protein
LSANLPGGLRSVVAVLLSLVRNAAHAPGKNSSNDKILNLIIDVGSGASPVLIKNGAARSVRFTALADAEFVHCPDRQQYS